MTPSAATRQAAQQLLVTEPSFATGAPSMSDSPDHLLCSFHRGRTGLFDESYISALRGQDPSAENHLISHFSRPVQIKLRARLRSPELIQDAFQETFLRVLSYFRSGKTLESPSSLPGFVHAICHNVALEFLRAHTRQDQYPERLREPVAAGLDPERQMVTEERRDMVRRLLQELSEKDRKLLKRIFLDDEDKDAVCQEFEVNRNYLRVLLYRARTRFKALVTHDSARTAAEG